uniref:Vacuolar protein sorting-associated protein 11 homolog n=1 Tax=Panstrongylus megistus TaxID=65343 RepID=A0A069DXR3_9HEMI
MAFLERRRFNFFDLKSDADGGRIADALGEARVTTCSSGYGLLILGDSSGNIHIVNKAFEIRTFHAYQLNITLVQQSRQSPYLVTIGEDECGINPIIKVWHVEKVDKNGSPVCLRISRASLPNKAVIPSCVAVTDNLSMMAIGFTDGSVLLYRGDVKRERTSKQKLLKDELSCITGVAFHISGKVTTLYVATVNSIEMYDVTHKDKEKRTTLEDTAGCPLRCSVLAEGEQDNHFFVARNNAIFCYTNGVRGPCYALGGDKIQLEWFRNYLVIIAKETKPTPKIMSSDSSVRDSNKDMYTLTILDSRNNFTVFSSPIEDASAVLVEWGSLYILSSNNKLSLVAEKDLQSKLGLLFKKNLYDVAIRMAKCQQYDADGLTEIFRQYGDHLYSKGEHKGAIEQYIKTIGKLEPSYVIRKYLGSQQVENLSTYLQSLHKAGLATGRHTTLLLNFYTKQNKPELLKEFIMAKDREVDFDVEVAIDVCRHVSGEDALLLAEKHGRHDWYLTIQIEDQKKYKEALDYIAKLEFDEAEFMIKKYGVALLENIPDETTKFLIKLCTNNSKNNIESNYFNDFCNINKSCPEDFIHYFINNSEMLIEFLEQLIQTSPKWSSHVYTTLLEHYLQVWMLENDETIKKQYEHKIMKMFDPPESTFDNLQALILCKAADFKPGILYLYDKNKMYQAILKYHVAQRDYASILCCCRRYENQEPGLWVQALVAIATHNNLPQDILSTILTSIERGKLLSPLLVIECLSNSPAILAGNIKGYLKKVLESELSTIEQQQSLIARYTKETDELHNNIDELMNKPIIFQGSRCGICKNQLELPTVHFLCQHSFHQHCIQSFAENENECPPCLDKNKQTIEAIQSQEENNDLHEMFHRQLERAEDGFSLVTDYLGRGVFTKLTNYTEVALRAAAIKTKMSSVAKPNTASINTQNPSYEKQEVVSNHTRGKYNKYREERDLIESNLSHSTSQVIADATPVISDRISASIQPQGNSMNPFGDDDEDDHFVNIYKNESTNPFGDDYDEEDEEDNTDDYDKNLNPFA